MNIKKKRGQTFFYTFMIGVTIIVLALAFAPVLKLFVENARASTVGDTLGLDCANASISYFNQATCIVTDVSMFGFIIGLIFLVGAVIGARVVFST